MCSGQSISSDPSKVTTRTITEQLNEDLRNQGNEGKDPVKTRVATEILKELGFRLVKGKAHNETGLSSERFENRYKVNLTKFGARNE